jgi:hypothetical protein
MLDLLIVDQMGKDISGSGLDTNVIGRKPGVPPSVQIRKIFVRHLTPESAGNATGIGNVDLCTETLVREMDAEVTRVNCEASGHPEMATLPEAFESERAAIEAGLQGVDSPRVAWIRNTGTLHELLVSDTCRPDLPADTTWGDPVTIAWSQRGELPSPWSD